jgi:transposase
MRAVVNGLMYILSTGCQWRYLPKDFPPCRRGAQPVSDMSARVGGARATKESARPE